MRSSIACARCRRSKTKCVNNGVNTTCRACESSGRQCTYPPPAVGGGVSRRESLMGSHPSRGGTTPGETPRRARPKRAIAPSNSNKESARPLLDALDATLLTPKVWQELFDIFQQHFSTDFPFLHTPTFLNHLRQTSLQSPPGEAYNTKPEPPRHPSASPMLLLSFLALTARFHPAIVAHHSPPTQNRRSNPIVASEYYATAARSYMDMFAPATLERVQSHLMVGFHDWGMNQGLTAWQSIGHAIRMAQALGLQFEQELDDMPQSVSLALSPEVHQLGVKPDRLSRNTILNKSDEFIEQEIRRRTFWSCFIMDRYLSGGKYRPTMLRVEELRIQLPSSERAFMFGEKVRTSVLGDEMDGVAGRAEIQNQRRSSGMLVTRNGDPERGQEMRNGSYGSHGDPGRNSDDNTRWEVGPDEGLLSRFIKVFDLYHDVAKWSIAGGRRVEKHPPWDHRSKFYNYQRQLSAFMDSLPRHLTLTQANISAHIASRTSTPYTLIHVVHLLCIIFLHREYVPFIPIRCSKPQGPLDPPLFPPDEYHIPPGFWDDSARELFKAARDLVDLVRTCQEWQVLVETPIVGFAIYTAAFCGVYCISFPKMDPNGFMCTRMQRMPNGSSTPADKSGSEAVQKALELTGEMAKRLQMADGWCRTIKRVYNYFTKFKKDFHRASRSLEASSESGSSSESYRHLSLREGGVGGGLEEYKQFEKIFKEFGDLEDEDLDMHDADSDGLNARLGHGLSEPSETGSAAVKSENMDVVDETQESASARQDRWNAINIIATRAGGSNSAPILNGAIPNHYHQHVPSPSQASSVPTHPEFSQQYSPHNSNGANALGHIQSYPPNAATESAQRASLSLQQNMTDASVNTPQQQHAALMATQSAGKFSPAAKEAWYNNMSPETRFGGVDIAAFHAGDNWNQWALQARDEGQTQGQWMGAIYARDWC
ncbi:hypothetical protein GQ43DRAFT_108989 [Delitschia confertaspora ATCC 74209]|uniref:Zn(2)-C6 fungal-type domain-containing protein n=1 Tax=Delitschia confertaspora ATCC 74209 TaxID=1513339 RepID=A0A9P4JYH6_9PLEO|nr:hypothetical protein GQ43DRAFT_108989 [Delitschia confertaspora ATCC 74209]